MNIRANPFVGPRAFARNEANLFFGRNQEARKIVSLIIANRTFLVYAESGAGKTSLINAKVISLLEKKGLDVLPVARVGRVISPEVDADRIDNVYVFNLITELEKTTNEPEKYASMVFVDYIASQAYTDTGEDDQRPRVIFLDQFEELFTVYPQYWNQRGAFFEQLNAALVKDTYLKIVFVIREDFLAQIEPYSNYLTDRLSGRFHLEKLSAHAGQTAIEQPVANTGVDFEEGVVDYIVEQLLEVKIQDIHGNPVSIPGEFVEPVQLQVVCHKLWNHLQSDDNTINKDDVQDLGGVDQVLMDFYEEIIERVIQEKKISAKKLRDWFNTYLVTAIGTRGMVVRETDFIGGIPIEIVETLQSSHLLNSEIRSGARWYELAHDRFVEPILEANERWYRGYRRRQQILWISSVSVLLVLVIVATITITNSISARELSIAQTQVALERLTNSQNSWRSTRVPGLGNKANFNLTETPQEIFYATATAQSAEWQIDELTLDGIEMVHVPAGCFWAGSLLGEEDEQPIFEYCIEEPFWIDRYEVKEENSLFPMINITWIDALEHCEDRGNSSSLPTEMQWEYAARGLNSVRYPWGNDVSLGLEDLVYNANAPQVIQLPTDGRPPARPSSASWIGAYDMSGNVDEWTLSTYSSYPYLKSEESERNTINERNNIQSVVRGGSYASSILLQVTTSTRRGVTSNVPQGNVGFRCVLPANS